MARDKSPARQCAGQPEPRKGAVLEPCPPADPVTGEHDHDESDAVPETGRRAQVRAERWLTVRTGRDEIEPTARVEQCREEARHHVASLVLEGERMRKQTGMHKLICT